MVPKTFWIFLRRRDWVGFGDVFLHRCYKESKTGETIDQNIYCKLAKLDAKLGTKASEQLYECLCRTTRSDIIKV